MALGRDGGDNGLDIDANSSVSNTEGANRKGLRMRDVKIEIFSSYYIWASAQLSGELHVGAFTRIFEQKATVMQETASNEESS